MNTRRAKTNRRLAKPRRGFVLVLAILVLLLVAAVAGTTHWASWRATRAARLAWNGERALHAADRGLVESVAAWDAGAFAAMDIGASRAWTTGGASVSLVRSAPLHAVLRATGSSATSGAPTGATRRLARWVRLEPAPLALPAALTVFGVIDADSSMSVDGRDVRWTSDGCGPSRDTASVMHVATNLATPPAVAEVRAFVDSAATRGASTTLVTDGASLPAGPAWSARIARAATTPVPLVPAALRLGGTSAHRGLLLVEGDLVLDGALSVEGLLVVTGSLEVRSGSLDVLGAMLVAREGATSRIRDTRVEYSPCSVARAMAAVAVTSRTQSWWSDW